jgi:hypothetical protein
MSFLISKFEYDYLSERKRTNRHARGERVWRRGDGAHHGICVVVVVVSSTASIVLALDYHYHPRERQWHIIHSFHEDETLDNNNNSRTSDYRSS